MCRMPVCQSFKWCPSQAWSEKKARIVTNVVLELSAENALTKRLIADCLQTRPINHRQRLVRVRGQLGVEELAKVDRALKMVFGLT